MGLSEQPGDAVVLVHVDVFGGGDLRNGAYSALLGNFQIG